MTVVCGMYHVLLTASPLIGKRCQHAAASSFDALVTCCSCVLCLAAGARTTRSARKERPPRHQGSLHTTFTLPVSLHDCRCCTQTRVSTPRIHGHCVSLRVCCRESREKTVNQDCEVLPDQRYFLPTTPNPVVIAKLTSHCLVAWARQEKEST